ncbi:transposase [Paracoccus sp. S-4012]|uniref:IS66-like element accessory protein TnpA n=1 Tax=Paracoccus sp. S-4012 TaxID=2665648 RepID=UPI0012AF3B00|nr:transposase [Paracoccus sp. S-4012]MRX51614.1 transposase [Paracoccus sp. S-4012]
MDGYLDGSSDGFSGRIDVIEGRGRRLRSEVERARIAAESLMPGAKVVDVARRHGVTRWQVYDWRRKLAAGKLAIPASSMNEASFAALVVEAPPPTITAVGHKSASTIELVVDGVSIRIGADVDEVRLSQVLRAVRTASR